MSKTGGKTSRAREIARQSPLPAAVLVNQIAAMILSGSSEGEVLAEVARRWPKEAARPLVVAAVQSISASADFDPDFMLGYCIQGTRQIHGKAMEAGELDTALRAVKLLADLTDR